MNPLALEDRRDVDAPVLVWRHDLACDGMHADTARAPRVDVGFGYSTGN